jgi:hypothetical protein
MTTTWRQVSRGEFIDQERPRRWIWVADMLHGFVRPMRDGETVHDAIEDFQRAGESAVKYEVYVDGVLIASGHEVESI